MILEIFSPETAPEEMPGCLNALLETIKQAEVPVTGLTRYVETDAVSGAVVPEKTFVRVDLLPEAAAAVQAVLSKNYPGCRCVHVGVSPPLSY